MSSWEQQATGTDIFVKGISELSLEQTVSVCVSMHDNVNNSTYLLKPHMNFYNSTFPNCQYQLLYIIELIEIHLIKWTNVIWCCLMENKMAEKHIYIIHLGINNVCMREIMFQFEEKMNMTK